MEIPMVSRTAVTLIVIAGPLTLACSSDDTGSTSSGGAEQNAGTVSAEAGSAGDGGSGGRDVTPGEGGHSGSATAGETATGEGGDGAGGLPAQGGDTARGGDTTQGGDTTTGGSPEQAGGGAEELGGESSGGGAEELGGNPSVGGSTQELGGNPSAGGGAQELGGSPSAGGGAEELGGNPSAGGGAQELGGNPSVGGGGAVRPEENTGTGFFVADGRLYDANGVEFTPRGVNRCHYDFNPDSESVYVSMRRANVNTVRISLPIWDAARSAEAIQGAIDHGMVPLPAVWYTDDSYTDESNVTCKDDVSYVETAVDLWVARYEDFRGFEPYWLLNIANEWGPSNDGAWRDAYIDAVTRLREVGYLGTLVVDTGGCGQNPTDLVSYAREVFNADPQHNVIFDMHVYGEFASYEGETYVDSDWPKPYYLPDALDELQGIGLPILIGEFGPGRNIGPSPSTVTPSDLIAAANARGFGWLAWAWDDNPGGGDGGFSLTTNLYYSPETSADDLTLFGQDVVEDPDHGLRATATQASIFASDR